MTGFSQSALLQALGWATLNSFWQAGVLWCLFMLVRRYLFLNTGQQYKLAVFALLLSASAFFGSFLYYVRSDVQVISNLFSLMPASGHWFHTILTAASVSYLVLLFVPAAKLVQNWRFLRRLRRSQLAKAPVQYRLYVQKIAGRLGIRKTVGVHLSALVQSPVTIGYLKPLILLPVASFNQLTTQQAEAILLHELAHIRRYDYLINIGISLVQTLLYFNPFVRLFVRVAEKERESCCDNLVLQFGYDPYAYAGALLHLEKEAAPLLQLVLGATGKNQLLSRIEAIVGLPNKMPRLKLQHFMGMLTSVLLVLALQSLVATRDKLAQPETEQTLAQFGNPFSFVHEKEAAIIDIPEPIITAKPYQKRAAQFEEHTVITIEDVPAVADAPPEPEPHPQFLQVAHAISPMDELNEQEQEQVAATIATTKKVLSNLEWKELERSVADGLTNAEKQLLYEQYQKNVEQINWKQVETNLALHFNKTDWEQLDRQLKVASMQMKLDSIETRFNQVLAHLNELCQAKRILPLPDQSVAAVKAFQLQLKQTLDSIKTIRNRPIVRF